MAVTGYAPRAVDATRPGTEWVARRVWELRDSSPISRENRRRIRDICNGGTAGLSALLGDLPQTSTSVPASNLILSGITRLAQQLGQSPTVRVDTPLSGNDSDRARRGAERRERIVQGYDEGPDPLALQLPQVGRWLPGYGFVSWVIREDFDVNGYRVPRAELRDPMDTFPGEWGPGQQPRDIVFIRRVPRDLLARLYPGARTQIYAGHRTAMGAHIPLLGGGGRVTDDTHHSGGWEGQRSDETVAEVAEYHDAWGCHVLLYDGTPLDAYASPLRSGPAFIVAKRYAFDKLQGQFDQVVGLLASMARLNILAEIATRDAVFAETVVTGRMDSAWNKGRGAINVIEGGDAKRLASNLPYQMFQEVDRIERQLRVTSGYSAQADGESPTSFATGRGLNELNSGANFEIAEYQLVLRYALQARDAKLLEWDDLAYPEQSRTIVGQVRGAAFSETYTPARHIKGNYTTRRAYGAMAGWDDYQKIVAGLQLMSAGVISKLDFQENVSGLENLERVNDRLRAEQAETALFGMITAGQPVDPRMALTLAALLPEGEIKDMVTKYWTPEEPQMSPEEAAMINGPPPVEAGPVLPEQPPDVATAMSLMRPNGTTGGGVQTVSTL